MKTAMQAALLDDAEQREAIDPEGALADVEGTPAQWRAAAELDHVRLDPADTGAIVVLGMGGSGISGDVLAALAAPRLPVPVIVHKGYGLPAFVGPGHTVIAMSYSGGTEETLSGAREAVARRARFATIGSGGELAELARQAGAPSVTVPGGGQPRHNLGKLVVPLLTMFGLDDGLDEALEIQQAVVARWGSGVPTAANPGKRLGARLRDGVPPSIYGAAGLSGLAALRLRCQLNENAKLPGVANVVPELCHNEVVGWEGESDLVQRAGIIWLRDVGDHERDARRVDVCDELLGRQAGWTTTITSEGVAPLARVASLLLQVDLVSVYAALAREVDPTPIASIDALKAALAAAPDVVEEPRGAS